MKHMKLTRSVAKAMRLAGINPAQINAVRKKLCAPKSHVVLGRSQIKRIEAVVGEGGVAVVTRKRVYAFDGYQSLLKHNASRGHQLAAARAIKAAKNSQGRMAVAA